MTEKEQKFYIESFVKAFKRHGVDKANVIFDSLKPEIKEIIQRSNLSTDRKYTGLSFNIWVSK